MLKKHKRLIRYGIIGVITQAIDLFTYWFLVQLGVNYLVADIINNPLVLGFNYFGHKYFTFEDQQKHKQTIGKYLLNLVINYIYSSIVLFIAVDVLRAGPFLGKIIQIVAIPLINYLLLKRFVFSDGSRI
jgi:putative flippase GtrA